MILKNGFIVIDNELVKKDILIEDGKIVNIGNDLVVNQQLILLVS